MLFLCIGSRDYLPSMNLQSKNIILRTPPALSFIDKTNTKSFHRCKANMNLKTWLTQNGMWNSSKCSE